LRIYEVKGLSSMALPLRPRLRALEIIPVGAKEEFLLALRDPEGFGQTLVLPYGAAVVAVLMNGKRSLAEVQTEFQRRTGAVAALVDVKEIVRQLDTARLLDGPRFREYRRGLIEAFLSSPVRPPSHAGGAYPDQPQALRAQFDALFTCEGGPGPIRPAAACNGRSLCGILSPHIDFHRGGPAFAWAYKAVVEHDDADLFVIFGTAHSPMQQLFCVSRKDFDTPLGTVRTDGQFVDRLAAHLASSVAGRCIDPLADELAHRAEHSIEFQALFLQYVLGGKRDFRIVPILVGSFQEFLADGALPADAPEVQAMLAAVRAAVVEHPGKVCYISGADFAHIGQRFGDQGLLDARRLAAQSKDDRVLLELACRCDAAGFFRHVARQSDRSRICGLSPTYTMLEALGSARGELLKYDQAVEPDGTSCVSFASAAFYRGEKS
jgi:MEMO1 family protein